MRVDAATTRRATEPGRSKAEPASFTIATEPDGTETAANVPQPATALPPAGLAMLTAEPGPAVTSALHQADQMAANHGRALLGALAGLQLASLEGAQVAARQTLADLARILPQATDPGLDSLLQAIAQRAAIELARSE